MKTLKYFMVLLFAVAVGSSCSDFLDKLPENVVPKDEVDYSDKSIMYQPVSAVYSLFSDAVSSWSLYGFYVIRDDQLLKGLSSDTDQGDLLDFKNSTMSTALQTGLTRVPGFGSMM